MSALPSGSESEAVRLLRQKIWTYYRENGRSFPWRQTDDPYQIMVSELMLQQTQTERVLKKYQRFLERFPDFPALASAPTVEVLRLWSGLGYNRRALGLKRSAEMICRRYGGRLPEREEQLLSLPMVGPATAGALQAFVFHRPVAFVETNIRRVILHFFFPRSEKVPEKAILTRTAEVLDPEDPRHWYYAMMDYGVYLKNAVVNPNRRSAVYRRQSPFENSNRQIRGRILAVMTAEGEMEIEKLHGKLDFSAQRIRKALDQLVEEGFVLAESSGRYRIRD